MRIRINKPFFCEALNRRFVEGEVVDMPPGQIDEVWMKAGLVMQDKSLDAAPETKATEPEPKPALETRPPRRGGRGR